MWIALTAAVAAAAVAAAGGIMARTSFRYQLDELSVSLDRLPPAFDGTKLLFISDIHRRTISDDVVARIQAAGGADLVLIGGDLRERKVPIDRTRSNVRQLARVAPIYVVYGNHDYDEDMRPLEVMLQEERAKVLVNESVILEKRDGSRIRLTGVDDPRTFRDRLELALSDPDDFSGTAAKPFTLVLAHDPILAKRMNGAQMLEVDLILSGHTHGGQITMPLIGPTWRGKEPSGYWRGWFDLAQREKTGATGPRLFVSCGFGTSRLPLRFGAPAQYHLLTLRSAASAPPARGQS
ncbi:metallophosphoesterase [Paenibacillus silvisoli]|uniref:metallophosphoesterase n=1 Tax=Paenibacillus silvisoli TaxID=3110539 RepID=UPI002805C885|nr:metallophosphoesterase [Paenibacillus silvisoli]